MPHFLFVSPLYYFITSFYCYYYSQEMKEVVQLVVAVTFRSCIFHQKRRTYEYDCSADDNVMRENKRKRERTKTFSKFYFHNDFR